VAAFWCGAHFMKLIPIITFQMASDARKILLTWVHRVTFNYWKTNHLVIWSVSLWIRKHSFCSYLSHIHIYENPVLNDCESKVLGKTNSTSQIGSYLDLVPVWARELPSVLRSPEVSLTPVIGLPKGEPLRKRTLMGDMYGSMEICQQLRKNSQSECLTAEWASLN